MSLSVILGNVTKPRKIEYVHTSSVHKAFARKALNEILESYPEYGNIILLLSQYYLLAWAVDKHPDFEGYISSFDKETADKSTKALLDIVKNAKEDLKLPEKQCIEAVHFGREDVSRYLMASHYKEAVINLCCGCYCSISKVFSLFISSFSGMKEEELLVCHDIDTLLLLQRNSPNADLQRLLVRCADQISGLNENTAEIGRITGLILSGVSETDAAVQYSKSRTYIRNKTHDGMQMIAILLWGFTTKNTLRWLLKGETYGSS